MVKHKGLCWLVSILVIIGALNWGLTGLGMLIGQPLNVVNLILGSIPTLEAVIYLLVGVAGLVFGYIAVTSKDCKCAGGKCE